MDGYKMYREQILDHYRNPRHFGDTLPALYSSCLDKSLIRQLLERTGLSP